MIRETGTSLSFSAHAHAFIAMELAVTPVELAFSSRADVLGHALCPVSSTSQDGETSEYVLVTDCSRGLLLFSVRFPLLTCLLPRPCPRPRPLPQQPSRPPCSSVTHAYSASLIRWPLRAAGSLIRVRLVVGAHSFAHVSGTRIALPAVFHSSQRIFAALSNGSLLHWSAHDKTDLKSAAKGHVRPSTVLLAHNSA